MTKFAVVRRSSSNTSVSYVSDCVRTEFGIVQCGVVLFNCYSSVRSALNEPAQLVIRTIVEFLVLH